MESIHLHPMYLHAIFCSRSSQDFNSDWSWILGKVSKHLRISKTLIMTIMQPTLNAPCIIHYFNHFHTRVSQLIRLYSICDLKRFYAFFKVTSFSWSKSKISSSIKGPLFHKLYIDYRGNWLILKIN